MTDDVLADLRTRVTAALAAVEAHKGTLTELMAAIEAEAARVPTLADVKALAAKL